VNTSSCHCTLDNIQEEEGNINIKIDACMQQSP
jgi:hypothetical protein